MRGGDQGKKRDIGIEEGGLDLKGAKHKTKMGKDTRVWAGKTGRGKSRLRWNGNFKKDEAWVTQVKGRKEKGNPLEKLGERGKKKSESIPTNYLEKGA